MLQEWNPPSAVPSLVRAGCGVLRPIGSLLSGALSLTAAQRVLLDHLLQSHAASRDSLLVGARGCGKSYVARAFGSVLGYVPAEVAMMHWLLMHCG